jgi:hypothetical protein
MSDFLWEVASECRVYLILMLACWLFAIATFANIFLTGRTHLLDEKGANFFKHFPGLLIAIAMIMTLAPYVVAEVVVKSVL